MKYERFEQVPVWKDAARLYVDVEALVGDARFVGHGDLRDQLLRATLSISNNIAEGFERGSTAELIAFLYYARGSAGEVRSMLTVMSGSPRYTDLKSQISDLRSRSESVSRQVRGWLSSLQNSDIKGQRHLNDATKAEWERRTRAQEFVAYLERVKHEAPSSDEVEPQV